MTKTTFSLHIQKEDCSIKDYQCSDDNTCQSDGSTLQLTRDGNKYQFQDGEKISVFEPSSDTTDILLPAPFFQTPQYFKSSEYKTDKEYQQCTAQNAFIAYLQIKGVKYPQKNAQKFASQGSVSSPLDALKLFSFNWLKKDLEVKYPKGIPNKYNVTSYDELLKVLNLDPTKNKPDDAATAISKLATALENEFMKDGIVKKYAIIINGDGGQMFLNDLESSTAALKKDGFKTYVSSPVESAAKADVYVKSSPEDIKKMLKELKSDEDDEIVIVTIGHGSEKGLCITDSCENDVIALLDKIKFGQRTVIMNQCFGGNWVSQFVDDPKTLFISSGSESEPIFQEQFSDYFWSTDVEDTDQDGTISWKERFNYASNKEAIPLIMPDFWSPKNPNTNILINMEPGCPECLDTFLAQGAIRLVTPQYITSGGNIQGKDSQTGKKFEAIMKMIKSGDKITELKGLNAYVALAENNLIGMSDALAAAKEITSFLTNADSEIRTNALSFFVHALKNGYLDDKGLLQDIAIVKLPALLGDTDAKVSSAAVNVLSILLMYDMVTLSEDKGSVIAKSLRSAFKLVGDDFIVARGDAVAIYGELAKKKLLDKAEVADGAKDVRYMFKDPDAINRAVAANTYGAMAKADLLDEGEAAIGAKALVELLSDPDAQCRQAAVKALCDVLKILSPVQKKVTGAIDKIKKLIDDMNYGVVESAVYVMLELNLAENFSKDEIAKAIKVLSKILSYGDNTACGYAWYSFGKLIKKDLVDSANASVVAESMREHFKYPVVVPFYWAVAIYGMLVDAKLLSKDEMQQGLKEMEVLLKDEYVKKDKSHKDEVQKVYKSLKKQIGKTSK